MDEDKFGTFYSTVCHVCKIYRSESALSDPLKICQGCRLISYCSVDHQQQHWSQHRQFCKTVQKVVKNLKISHIYDNAVDKVSSKRWCELRIKLKMLCEAMLCRSLSTCESEMLFFPRICLLCHKIDPRNGRDCDVCHCVSYCCDEHMREDAMYHSKSCKELKVGFDFDMFATQGTLPVVNLEFGKRKFCQSADEFLAAFMNFASETNNFVNHPLAEVVYFTILSCSLTFIHSVFNAGMHTSEKLIVHLIGASNFELQHLDMWDVAFHWLPNLTDLHLILIGPEVCTSPHTRMCSNCQTARCKLTVEYFPGQLYHDYVISTDFTKPDFIMMFNSGLSEYIGVEEDTWQKSIPFIVSFKCPVAMTSYTMLEAKNDLKRLVDFNKEINVLIDCKRNKFSGKKPMRDWEQFNSHSDTLVFYHNAYVTVLVPS